MRRYRGMFFGLAALLVSLTAVTPVEAEGRDPASGGERIDVRADLAPVAPNGLATGAPTDFVLTFRDGDPAVPGVGLLAGGTVRVTLPDEFVNQGVLPVAGTGSLPGCAPPLVTTCSSAVLLQGWPQSPILPFPEVTWDADTNTIVLTARTDWLPAGISAPGPKQVHLILLGFTNPTRPGRYRVDVEIQPDPSSDRTLEDSTRVRISNHVRPSVRAVSLANGAPPPPFPNPLYQSVEAGDPSLTMMLYLWGRDSDPLVGADFEPGNDRVRSLRDGEGRRVGWVRVRAPRGARDWSLASTGPAVPGAAFLTGLDTAVLRAGLQTDPAVPGRYQVKYQLRGGNTVVHTIVAR